MVEPIADELWGVPHEVRQPGGVRLPVRMTIWRLPGRRLVLHSPVPVDDALAAELAGLGEVTHLIAPSRLHHLWIVPAARRWPDATVWLARGLTERYPDLRAEPLGDEAPVAWRDEVEQLRIDGAPRVEEVVFHHRATRTLICTDLLFHVTRPANLRTRMVLRMMGTAGGRLAASRAWRFFARDKAAAARSVSRVGTWEIERIVPAHGEVWVGDGRAALAAAHLERIGGRARLEEERRLFPT